MASEKTINTKFVAEHRDSVLRTIEDTEYDLLYRLNLGTQNNFLVDERNKPVKFNNKFIFYPKNSFSGGDKNIIEFDPFFNIRLMSFFVNYYLRLQYKETGLVVKAISMMSPQNSPFSSLTNTGGYAMIRCIDGNMIRDIMSHRYFNETLQCIDLIYTVDGEDISPQLTEVDMYMSAVKWLEVNVK